MSALAHLKQTPELLRNVKARLYGLEVTHLNLVIAMAHSHQVFVFIKAEGEEFSARLQMLRCPVLYFSILGKGARLALVMLYPYVHCRRELIATPPHVCMCSCMLDTVCLFLGSPFSTEDLNGKVRRLGLCSPTLCRPSGCGDTALFAPRCAQLHV